MLPLRFGGFLLFVALLIVPARAWAEPPAGAIAAIVDVDAFEHHTLGAVVGDGRDVLVPFDAIEVDRPGRPDATVIDRNGARIPATLVATDLASGLALLRVGAPLTDKPFAISSRTCVTGPVSSSIAAPPGALSRTRRGR